MDEQTLIAKLNTALRYIKRHCVIGSSNKTADVKRTNGYSTEVHNRWDLGEYKDKTVQPVDYIRYELNEDQSRLVFSKFDWVFDSKNDGVVRLFPICESLSPLDDPDINLTDSQRNLLKRAILAQNFRKGNCGDLSRLLCKYLWENFPQLEKIEYISCEDFDHAFVMVNRMGDIEDPNTWGNAWVIDPWYKSGEIFKASKLKTEILKIAQFAKQQCEELTSIGINFEEVINLNQVGLNLHVVCSIIPKTDNYPSYLDPKIKPVEDYYFLKNNYPKDTVQQNGKESIDALLASHKNKFIPCLNDINKAKKNDPKLGSLRNKFGPRRSLRLMGKV